MGDRVLFQVKGPANRSPLEVSPVLYCHWDGARAPEICRSLAARMEGRPDDVSYTMARLVQIAIGDDKGNLSFGVWNHDKVLTAEDSHGDAGCVVITVAHYNAPMKFECLGSSDGLRVGADGFPEFSRETVGSVA